MRLLLLCLLAVTFASPVNAAETTWTPIKISAWKGKQDGPGRYDLSAGLVETDIEIAPMDGKWIRISAITNADAANVMAWVTVFDGANKVLSRNLPTMCTITGNRKLCQNVAWVKPGGVRLRLGYYANFEAVTVEPGAIEWAEGRDPTPATVARYAKLRKHIASAYYRSAEFDWTGMSPEEQAALRAPEGVDPIPHAVQRLITRLPGNAHTSIYASGIKANAPSALVLPTCERLGEGTWKLNVPGTPARRADSQRYLRAAHGCLANGTNDKWLVNLTEHMGGDAQLTIAALAPILGTGKLMMYKNPAGNEFMVALTPRSVTNAGRTEWRWKAPIPTLTGPVTFVWSGGCASACEALAIAVKGRFKSVGQPTAGFTTANESIVLNKRLMLALTEGIMADSSGRAHEKVIPDLQLDEEQIGTLLAGKRVDGMDL